MNHWQATAAISSKAARVFDGTLDSAQTLTVWEAAGQEDVLATNPEDPTMGPGVPDLPMTDEEVNQIFFHPDKIAEFIAGHTK